MLETLAYCLLVVNLSNHPRHAKRDGVDELLPLGRVRVPRNSCRFHTHYVLKNETSKASWYISEIQRNREFYKNADVRPPFTYASLIRQVSEPFDTH